MASEAGGCDASIDAGNVALALAEYPRKVARGEGCSCEAGLGCRAIEPERGEDARGRDKLGPFVKLGRLPAQYLKEVSHDRVERGLGCLTWREPEQESCHPGRSTARVRTR